MPLDSIDIATATLEVLIDEIVECLANLEPEELEELRRELLTL